MAIKAGADGCTDAADYLPNEECCPPGLGEISYCGMACAFIQLLPAGPLWDRPKAEALAFYQEQHSGGACGPSECVPISPGANIACASLVQYSVYLSNILMDLLLNALWPSIREADPFRAATTLDEWLDRLGWEDCYNTACRSPSLGLLGPYDILGECGPIFCPAPAPAGLECALKRAIVHALSRASMGGIRTLCWLNWVIAPLGAQLEAFEVEDDPTCATQQFVISRISDTLPACPTDLCPAMIDVPQGTVPAVIIRSICDRPAGSPEEIWPGILSAECIIRSLIPYKVAKRLHRSC